MAQLRVANPRPMSTAARTERARIASLSYAISAGKREPDCPEIIEARRNFHAARLADYIERTMASAPALTAEQTERIVALVRAGGATG